MKVKSILFIPCALFLLAGCRFIAMKMYGIKNPGVENEKSILRTARKYQLDTSGIVTVSSKEYARVLKGQGIPDAAVYDKEGKYIEYRQTDTSCNAGLFGFIPALDTNGSYKRPAGLSLDQQLARFRSLKGDTLKDAGAADFYLLIYWAVYTGKLNKDHVKAWEDLARENKKCRIRVIKVNLDMQEYWNAEERDKIIQALSRKK